jgi:hypothetical protein
MASVRAIDFGVQGEWYPVCRHCNLEPLVELPKAHKE